MLSGKWRLLVYFVDVLLAALSLTEGARVRSSATNFHISGACTLWHSQYCGPSSPKQYDLNTSTPYFWFPVSWSPCNKACGGGVQACNTIPCSVFKLHELPWSECNRTCGIGYQAREIICKNHLGNIVDLGHCEVQNFSLSRPCNTQPCNSSYWEVSTWSRCDAPCSGGKRKRIVMCKHDVIGAANAACFGKPPHSEQVCNSHPCQTYAWLVGPWEDCPNGCQAYKNRIVQCVDGFGNEKPDIMCTGTKPAYSSWCRRRNLTCSGCLYSDCLGNGLCQEGTCSCFEGWEGAHCERSRQCRGFLGYLDNNTVICCSLVDVKQRCCLSSAAVLDRDGDCCESGKLDVCGVCDGFAIMVDAESKCCTTVRDEKGLCCQSGVLDECHICDGDGTSCATNITLKLNVTSTFANMQDLSSLPSLVHSTASHIASKLNIRSEAISVTGIKVMNLAEDNCHYDTVGRNYCMQGGHFTGIVVVNITVAPIYTESIIRKMDVIDALQPGPLSLGEPLFLSEVPFRAELLHIDHVSRSGVCGNGLCERGERCNTEGNSASLNGQPCCFKDCPYVSSSCPGQTFGLVAQLSCSGNGICLDSTGQCSCFEGYAGLDCSECVLDWIPISHASCVKVPDSKTLARLALAYAGGSLHPSIPGDFAPNHSHVKLNPSYTGSKLSVGVIVGILVGSVGVMLMTILLAIFTLFPKKKSTASPSPRSTLRCIEIPETPRGPGENGTPQSKLPLWRTSFLGPQTDFGYFDIIPITPMAKRVPLNQLACIPDDENDGTTSKSTLSNPQHMSCKIASTLASDEDLTEEEQSKITTKVKKALKRGESARFVTDFLTDSESDSETLEPDSDCEPHLAFVLDVPSPATPRNCPLHVQFNP